jgi:pyruvate ferredoxin oxidoreductase delta subunit
MAITYKSKFESCWYDANEGLITVETGDWRAVRPRLDKSPCRQCGWCSILCPVGCMQPEADGYFHPNLKFCKGCGICVYECPANALTLEKEEDS